MPPPPPVQKAICTSEVDQKSWKVKVKCAIISLKISMHRLPYELVYNCLVTVVFKNDCKYSLNTYKCHNDNFKKIISKKFRKWFYFLPAFYLIMCLMQAPKNYEKIAIMKFSWCIFRY